MSDKSNKIDADGDDTFHEARQESKQRMYDTYKTKEELYAGSTARTGGAKSNDPLSHLTIDLTTAAITAWEQVRDRTDLAEKGVAIIVDPKTFVMIAIAGVGFEMNRAKRSQPSESDTARVLSAIHSAQEAVTSGAGGGGVMSWAGMPIYPDARADYIAVGLYHRTPDHPLEVFNQEAFDALKASLVDMLDKDAQLAAFDSITPTVSGVVGNA